MTETASLDTRDAQLSPAGRCPLTVHAPNASRDRHVAVLYLHGGGLLYGERDDLPRPYVRLFTDAGYTMLCMDYPLAPETALPEILDAVFDGWRAHVAQGVADGSYEGYYLFGRSSGAYLALMLAARISRDPSAPQPLGILDFYGYPDLHNKAFIEPAKAYTALPAVERRDAERIVGSAGDMPTSGPKALRYALYVHARQQPGAWLDLLGLTETDGVPNQQLLDACSLGADDIAHLPRLFITASSADEDVPFRISKTLARQAPDAVMKPVYYLPHDFDRDTTDSTGLKIYQQALTWMQ